MGVGHGVRDLIWGPVPATARERRLLHKIDWFILSFLCLQYFVNVLDRANFANAYVSGMKTALHFKGHQYNNVIAFFSAGNAFGQIPSNLLLHRVPARILFPACGVFWGICTMLTACARTVQHVYVLKFLQGVAEGSTFVGAHYVMGSWYKEAELGKRAAIFSASAQVATLFSGVLQAALYTNLNGRGGLAGWQWLFIICGVITIPIAAYGFFFFPDTPSTTSARYFSAEEKAMAVSRLPRHAPTHFNLSLLKRVLCRWHIYLFSLIWVAGGGLEAFGTTALHALWMQAQNARAGRAVYSVREINYFPTGATAVSIVALLGTAVWTDRTGRRWHANVLVAACLAVSAGVLLAYDQTSVGAKFFAFYLSGVSYAGQAINFSWANEVMRADTQERSVVLAAMNVASYAVNIALSVEVFPATAAPYFRHGMISILVFAVAIVFLSGGARWLQRKDLYGRERGGAGAGQGEGGGKAGSEKETEAEEGVKEKEVESEEEVGEKVV